MWFLMWMGEWYTHMQGFPLALNKQVHVNSKVKPFVNYFYNMEVSGFHHQIYQIALVRTSRDESITKL
jgi:hypothetical protein